MLEGTRDVRAGRNKEAVENHNRLSARFNHRTLASRKVVLEPEEMTCCAAPMILPGAE